MRHAKPLIQRYASLLVGQDYFCVTAADHTLHHFLVHALLTETPFWIHWIMGSLWREPLSRTVPECHKALIFLFFSEIVKLFVLADCPTPNTKPCWASARRGRRKLSRWKYPCYICHLCHHFSSKRVTHAAGRAPIKVLIHGFTQAKVRKCGVRYLKTILKESNDVSVLCYLPPLVSWPSRPRVNAMHFFQ